MSRTKTLVIKIGTNVITTHDGLLDEVILRSLVAEITEVQKNGARVLLVSSGAMGAGRGVVKLPEKANPVTSRQILAAVGQIHLIQRYATAFAEYGVVAAQVLATKEDFRDRRHYLNMKHCFDALLSHRMIPVINENDVVSVTELMFTDNDELAGLIAAMMEADRLLLLTNVDGLMTGHPSDPSSKRIGLIRPTSSRKQSPSEEGENMAYVISKEKSQFGRGGMATKYAIATKLAGMGIEVCIANGKKSGIIRAIEAGDDVGTRFLASARKSGIKKWVAASESTARANVLLNQGAVQRLREGPVSVLPVGIMAIEGDFQKGDVIRFLDAESRGLIGVGIAQYASEKARAIIGLRGQKELVHYNYLYLT